jgi:cytochrome b involved in lipid metabolism
VTGLLLQTIYSDQRSSSTAVVLANSAVSLRDRPEDPKLEDALHTNVPVVYFKQSIVSKHKTKETGVWVTYNGSVYDITEFIAIHPGTID